MKQKEQKSNMTLWAAVAVIAVAGAFGVLWYQEAQEKQSAAREAHKLLTEAQRKQKEHDQKTALVLDQWLRTQFREADWLPEIQKVSLDRGHAQLETRLEKSEEARSQAKGASDAIWLWARENKPTYQICRVSVLAIDRSLLYESAMDRQLKVPQPPADGINS